MREPFWLSSRLLKLWRVLKAAGKVGVTSFEIRGLTGAMAPSTDVADLRKNGFLVSCKYERLTADNHKVFRYWLGYRA